MAKIAPRKVSKKRLLKKATYKTKTAKLTSTTFDKFPEVDKQPGVTRKIRLPHLKIELPLRSEDSESKTPPHESPAAEETHTKKFKTSQIKLLKLPSLHLPRLPIKIFLVTFLLLLVSLLVWIFWGIPLPTKLDSVNNDVSTKLYDRNGQLIYEIFADKRRTPIPLDELPDHVWQATLAIEDKDFYSHPGFSITGMARAAYSTLFRNRLQGGSTLTQQLVKNALLTPERTVRRKIRELALTISVETLYTKDQILEMYLNQIPYGSTAYGIESASELYFDKPAKDLTLPEASLLAGLLASPTRYSPFGAQPESSKVRQSLVLGRMVEEGYITQQQADEAKEAEISFATPETLKAPHFALLVKQQLVDKYGEKMVEQGGLRVTTTLDLELQEFAEDVVATEVGRLAKSDVGNGAALVTRPKTGEILAMVGSKDYFAEDEDGKVNVLLRNRQPGSSIKPLNYALALRDGKVTASSLLADVPTCFTSAGSPLYCPKNYDGLFHGGVQARFALGNSFNVPAVRTLALNGLEEFITFATQMGITSFQDPSNYGLSLTLGGGEVRPIDMAVAFGTLANGGINQPLLTVLKVEDWQGNVVEETDMEEVKDVGQRVLDTETSFIVSHILLDNNARSAAFGASSYLNVAGHQEVSVKTGTTNDRRDNWTIGYTSQVLALSWVGNNDNSPMSGAVSGVSGASQIWNKIIKNALDKGEEGYFNPEDQGHAWPQKPDGVVGLTVCADSGQIPVEGDPCPPRFEYFLAEHLPSSNAGIRQQIPIDRTTSMLAKPDTAPENIEMQEHPFLRDPLGTPFCLDCVIPDYSITVQYPLGI